MNTSTFIIVGYFTLAIGYIDRSIIIIVTATIAFSIVSISILNKDIVVVDF